MSLSLLSTDKQLNFQTRAPAVHGIWMGFPVTLDRFAPKLKDNLLLPEEITANRE
jgi:hypothetical protein